MRRAVIELTEVYALSLSKEKQAELTEYMRVFSSPFLAQVYGDSDADIENFDQLISMFANPKKCSPTRKLIEKARSQNYESAELPGRICLYISFVGLFLNG